MINENKFKAEMLRSTRACIDNKYEEAFGILSAMLELQPNELQRLELHAMRGSVCQEMNKTDQAIIDFNEALKTEAVSPYSRYSILLSCAALDRQRGSLFGERRSLIAAAKCAIDESSICIASCVKRLMEISHAGGKHFRLTQMLRTALTHNWVFFELSGSPDFVELDRTLDRLMDAEQLKNRSALMRLPKGPNK